MNLFKLFSKKEKTQTLSMISTDIHSHLLPGIDDGVKTIEDSLALIKAMKELGFYRLITTPHIRAELYPNTHEIINTKLEEVREAVSKEGIDIKIEAAAEYYVDDTFLEIMRKEKLLTFGKDNYLLIEFSYLNKPMYIKSLIFDLQSLGYKVVLAHPERYSYFNPKSDLMKIILDNEVYLQLNMCSLVKFYDSSVSVLADKLINLGHYTFVGSDLHNYEYLKAYKSALNKEIYQKLFQKCTIMNDMI